MSKVINLSNDLVYVRDEEPITTSLKVAEVFGKNHCDVIRAIRKKSRNYTKSFTERNFAFSEYLDETGKSNPMYELTRNGFAVLALGFTGKLASEFQEKFMEEFDRRGRIINELNFALPKSRRKNRHKFGYYQVDVTPDGKTETTWVTGAKTIEEMNELENHSRLQSKRLKTALGHFKAFLENLSDRERYQEKYIDMMDDLGELVGKFKFEQKGPAMFSHPFLMMS
ncbi:Rha family transcriptional regulator [Pseudobacteriovorax antillogorgiicola]|uniref:Phage regulatory protein, rha family n=1 Tax=Pseudobacteriovorax antillogorgiicola TaxID=1513793 RepID=A0A1Y6C3V8_9BACT|nr:Rha family transcriptional regulator [Pseudobacteriovorax antillogorgiicola]TCS43378.1 Rha family phage regulatory protein [Pseudobacteriovorax antillogorgiicola]SMF34993.1 phage regulatory protein, rha family [Pseudobacteriovorax antillogorgiicola]